MNTTPDIQNPNSSNKPNRKIRRGIIAVSVGTIIDGVGSMGLNLIFIAIFIFQRTNQLTAQGLSDANLQNQLATDVSNYIPSIPLMLAALLVPLVAGYVAGRIAKQNEVVYGLLTGILTTIIVRLCRFATNSTSAYAFPIGIFLTILSTGVDTLGGYLAYKQRTKISKSPIV